MASDGEQRILVTQALPGMVLSKPVVMQNRVVLCSAGMELSASVINIDDELGARLAARTRAPETLIALQGLAVATSGDYRRWFEHDGRRYSHTIDPRTGWPIGHGLASVTVLHADCMAADALSTAINVLGPDAGLAFAERLGLAARLLVRVGAGFDERMSAAFAAMLR